MIPDIKCCRLFSCLIFVAAFLFIISPLTEAIEPATMESLAEKIEAILELEKASGGVWAIEVVSLDTGQVLCDMNARRAMVPASNMKLFTTAAALHYLGPDFVTRTSIYLDGTPGQGGILDGDLILYGRGDPNISGRFHDSPTSIFEGLAGKLKAMGLRHIRGDVVGDDSHFDNDYYGPWLPNERHKWYAARVSALSFNDNCIDIYVKPGTRPGGKASVVKSPHTSFARVVNRASTTNRKKNAVWISPLGNGRDILVGGKIWTGKEVEELWFPVESPPLYAATVFKETLERNGIEVSGKPRALGDDHTTAVPQKAVPVLEYTSLPLSEMIKVINKRSQNLHAELMLKHIGLHHAGTPTFADGAKAISDFVKTTEIAPGSVIVKDGSGLCRENRASAHSIVQLLRHMNTSENAQVFKDSLAISGIDKSLKGMTWIVPKGKIRGKTGWLKGTLAFSGYVEGETRNLVFSIVVNDYTADSARIRRARDRICAELTRY